jgi:hypothetical protein
MPALLVGVTHKKKELEGNRKGEVHYHENA